MGGDFDEFVQQANMIMGGDPLDRDFLSRVWDGAGEDPNIAINHLLGYDEDKIEREGKGGSKKKSTKKEKKKEKSSSESKEDTGFGDGGFGDGGFGNSGGFGAQSGGDFGGGGFGNDMGFGGQMQQQMPMQQQQMPMQPQQMPMQTQMPQQMQQQTWNAGGGQNPQNDAIAAQLKELEDLDRQIAELQKGGPVQPSGGFGAPGGQMGGGQPNGFGDGFGSTGGQQNGYGTDTFGQMGSQSFGGTSGFGNDGGFESESDSDNDWWHNPAQPSYGSMGSMGPGACGSCNGCGGGYNGCGGGCNGYMDQGLGPAGGCDGGFNTLQSASQFPTQVNGMSACGGMGGMGAGMPQQQMGGPQMGWG